MSCWKLMLIVQRSWRGGGEFDLMVRLTYKISFFDIWSHLVGGGGKRVASDY